MEFPDDENGDVFRRMVRNGDNLSVARDIDFVVVFPSEASAQTFGSHFADLGYKVSVERAEVKEGFPWDVKVVNHMLPTHKGVTDFETLLGEEAAKLGGVNDGWGSLAQS